MRPSVVAVLNAIWRNAGVVCGGDNCEAAVIIVFSKFLLCFFVPLWLIIEPQRHRDTGKSHLMTHVQFIGQDRKQAVLSRVKKEMITGQGSKREGPGRLFTPGC